MKLSPGIKIVLASLVIFILSFPKIEPVAEPGIDPSLRWAYNYFFRHGIPSGTEILFTHGPLGFLISPLPMGWNLPLGILLISVIGFLFCYSFLRLIAALKPNSWGWFMPLVFLLVVSLGTEYGIVGITACSLMLHSEKGGKAWLLTALLFAVLGLYVKAYIGLIAMINVVSYAAVRAWMRRNWREPAFIVCSIVGFFCLSWLLIYGSLAGSSRFLYATIEFSRDNSSASSLYPENNWWVLGACIITAVALPFLMRERKTWAFYGTFALAVFAGWKHGMTREDIYHVESFFFYLALVFSLLFLIAGKVKPYHLALGLSSLLFFHLNLKNCENYRDYSIPLSGPANFTEAFFGYGKMLKAGEEATAERMKPLKMDKGMLEAIGADSVDVYPWNFAYIPANVLNWRPRPVLQSYATYTPWLDAQNARHFRSAKAPQHILWELISDRWGGELGSIDDRYVLNDEPQTILAILDRYRLSMRKGALLLFTKDEGDYLGESRSLLKQEAAWDEWLKIPEAGEGILRAHTAFSSSFLRFLKTQLYKDEAFYIEYKLGNGEIKKYRFVPAMAAQGIWVNPLVLHPSAGFSESPVKEIRFSCSSKNLVHKPVDIEWVLTPFSKKTALFGEQAAGNTNSPAAWVSFGFETGFTGGWEGDAASLSRAQAHTGKSSAYLNKDRLYSPSYSVPFKDSIGEGMSVTASVWALYPGEERTEAKLVISVEEGGKAVYWEAVLLADFVSNSREWQPASITRRITGSYGPGAKLKVYVMNPDREELYIDDMELHIGHGSLKGPVE